MAKKIIILVLIFAGLAAGGGFFWLNKSGESPKTAEKPSSLIKKVDMAAQPDWVQKLEVMVKTGVSANGLKNATFTVKGMPQGLVESLEYIVQYQTANKGSQGAISTKPIPIDGKTEYSKTVEFGSCSTKTCVRFEGVTEIELELDFTTKDAAVYSFVKTLPL